VRSWFFTYHLKTIITFFYNHLPEFLAMTNPNFIITLDQLVFNPQSLPTLLQKARAAQKILDQNPNQTTAFILIDLNLFGPQLPPRRQIRPRLRPPRRPLQNRTSPQRSPVVRSPRRRRRHPHRKRPRLDTLPTHRLTCRPRRIKMARRTTKYLAPTHRRKIRLDRHRLPLRTTRSTYRSIQINHIWTALLHYYPIKLLDFNNT